MSLRLGFMGTPDFSVNALKALIEAGHEIACVYSQPPRKSGRGQKLTPTPVHAYAETQGIEVRTPLSLKDEAEQKAFADLNLDACVVVAYGLILPQAILDAPRHGCFNIHASLLPRWRGAAPIQRAIEAGDRQSGVTIMQMDAGLDTGPMLVVDRLDVDAMTAGQLHDALADMGARLMVEALAQLEAGTLTATAQPDDGATYAKKILKGDDRLDWTKSAEGIERTVRAFHPRAWFEYQGERIRVLEASVEDGSGTPGTTLDDSLLVACGQRALRLNVLQRPGKKPMAAADLLRGYSLSSGVSLS